MAKLKWQFGQSLEELEKEVDAITGFHTVGATKSAVEQLMERLPARIKIDDIQDAKLTIEKLSDLVWCASYKAYKNPGKKDFELRSVLCSTEPTLLLALYNLYEQLGEKK